MRMRSVYIIQCLMIFLAGCHSDECGEIFQHIKNDNAVVVQKYLSSGGAIQCVSENSETLMDVAIDHNSTNVVRVLLKSGCPSKNINYKRSYFHYAAFMGNVFIVNEFISQGVKINEKDDGETALMFSVMRNHLRSAVLLLSHGADPYIRSDTGSTMFSMFASIEEPVDMEVIFGWEEIIKNLNRQILFRTDDELEDSLAGIWNVPDGNVWIFEEGNILRFGEAENLDDLPEQGSWQVESGILKVKVDIAGGEIIHWFFLLDLSDDVLTHVAYTQLDREMTYIQDSLTAWERESKGRKALESLPKSTGNF